MTMRSGDRIICEEMETLNVDMLCMEMTETELFEYIQYAHDQRIENYFGPGLFVYKMIKDPMVQYFCNGQVPSPQTNDQRNQVRRIANFL